MTISPPFQPGDGGGHLSGSFAAKTCGQKHEQPLHEISRPHHFCIPAERILMDVNARKLAFTLVSPGMPMAIPCLRAEKTFRHAIPASSSRHREALRPVTS